MPLSIQSYILIALALIAAIVIIVRGGELLCDSGWVELPHSQPLTGTDVARALWPARGRVTAKGCEVTWSERELLPVVPAGLEV